MPGDVLELIGVAYLANHFFKMLISRCKAAWIIMVSVSISINLTSVPSTTATVGPPIIFIVLAVELRGSVAMSPSYSMEATRHVDSES